MSDLKKVADRFLIRLGEAQAHRGSDPWKVWSTRERGVMRDLVNEERRRREQPPVTAADIERVERSAVGHFDYSRKFALYCAVLALETPST